MVTIAVRVSPPPAAAGATISPTSASLRSTVPSKGARMRVFSRLTSACWTWARAALRCASSTSTRVRAFSSSAADNTCRSASACARSRSRCAWPSCASTWPTFARAEFRAAAWSPLSRRAMTSPRRTNEPSWTARYSMRPAILAATEALVRATT